MIHVNWRASSLHAAVVGVVNAVLQVVTTFGVDVSGSQDVAITGATNAILVLLSVVLIASTSSAPPGGAGAK